MAKGSLFLGQAKGKVGTTVMYVAGGEQRTRLYTREGGRPGDRASLPARVQRVRFGAASNEWALYRFMCSNMFKQGKRTNESDYNFFVRRNWQYFPFLTRSQNEAKKCYWIPGTYATGNLGTVSLYMDNEMNNDVVTIQVTDLATSGQGVVKSNDSMVVYERFLQSAYPNASKLTFAIMYNGLNGEVAGTPNTPNSRLHTYTLDLVPGVRPDVDSMQVHEFLAQICSNAIWQEFCAYLAEHEVEIAKGSVILSLSNSGEAIDTTVPGDEEPQTPSGPTAPGRTYTITYMHNGSVYQTQAYEAGATITAPAPPSGYTWQGLPATMPNRNLTINAIDPDGEIDGLRNSSSYEIIDEDSRNCIIAVFPTNERANDVYTVNMLPFNLSDPDGPFIDYMAYRDEDALAAAANSYGYAADTMHANIYYSGDSVAQDLENTIAIIRSENSRRADEVEQNKEYLRQVRLQAIAERKAAVIARDAEIAEEVAKVDALVQAAVAAKKKKKK